MISAAVLGYGTVGGGVVEVLQTNSDVIAKRVGDEINVKYILDLRDFPGDKNENLVVHDYDIIVNDPEVKIICETMGGVEPAFTFSKKALAAGKSVCTSNKELVAAHGPELIALAKENNCNYLFEASVGGGIPIIRPIVNALTSEKIDGIYGILNGTTNYILTKMEKEGARFEDVLKEAQDKGYAEKNPEADVEGYDAVRKLAILSSLVYGKNVDYNDIYTEGITKITPEDFAYAKALGKTIKLIAMGRETADGRYAMVSPRMISSDNPLYCAQDVFNAILLHSDMLGDSMYYGRGAGKLPTASAVCGDVIEMAKNPDRHLTLIWDAEKQEIKSKDTLSQQYFVRVAGNDASAVKVAFGDVEFVAVKDITGEIAFVTGVMTEKEYADAAAKISGIKNMIRI
ncbi:MAG: homoserine dehydrogenase [Lachnospiraceae bacterium]|nr:homoserine dehydrogenase [Lachnospiraceae bacterium]